MPASRSKRAPDPPPPKRRIWPIILLVLLCAGVVAAIALPASLIARFLPPTIHAEDFSGNIWHGSAAKVTAASRPLGAFEWRLQPRSLLTLSPALDLRWVKGSTAIDGLVTVDRQGFVARAVHGGGNIEDLHEFGVAPGWRGTAALDLPEIKGTFDAVTSAKGIIDVSALASSAIAGGADLGSYRVTLAQDAVEAGSFSAVIEDTGGPLETHADLRYTAASRVGTLMGTLKERPEASDALRAELTDLSQLKPRDGAGRIPVDFEFNL